MRGRDAISPSTLSISISVNGGASRVINKPTLTGSPSTTSVAIDAPVGTDSFTFDAWDQQGGAGNILDTATTTQTIVANADNAVSVALDGVCAGLVPSLSTASAYSTSRTSSIPLNTGSSLTALSSVRMVGPFPATINISEVDADGNTLLSSGVPNPIVLTESGPTQHVSIAPVATTAGNTKFTLTPILSEPDASPTTITATSASCGTGTAFFPNTFSLSTAAILYVADSVAGVIAFDQDGTELAKISSTTGITGLAYNSKSASIVTVEPKSSTSGGIVFQTLSLTGSSLGSGSVTTSAPNPVGNIAYNPVNGNFLAALRYYVTNSTTYYGSVLEYSISGSTATPITPTGTNPFMTGSTAPPPYDPDCFVILANGNVVVGDSMTNSYLFDPNGNYLNHAVYSANYALTLDTLRGNILDFYGPNYGEAYSVATFDNYTTTSIQVPMSPNNADLNAAVYNPGEDEVYGFSPSFAFGISGSALGGNYPNSNLPAGAFSGLTSPTEAFALP